MIKILSVLFFLAVLQYGANAQLYQTGTFKLAGKINVESAKILLIPIGDSSYYPEKRGVIEAAVNHGKFSFKGAISYPYAFILQAINDSDKLIYVSSVFFIDSGMQKINCNIKIAREKPVIVNITTEEKNGAYNKMYIPIRKEFSNYYRKNDSIYKKYDNKVPVEILSIYSKEYRILNHKQDLILLQYTKEHPDSFVALWELVSELNSGYQSIYDSIYSQLSLNLKHTVTGKRLYEQLRSSAVVNIGEKFPPLLLLNVQMEKNSISIDKNKKYTLIDFWFSHCFSCISQFGELKALFKKYNKNALDIISISVDESAQIDDWKSAISKYDLPWKECLDLGGREAQRLSIQEFPTNLLLDKSGKIIATNLAPSELKLMLEKRSD